MELTITKLAKLAGISTRTLRYYQQCGLLQPLATKKGGQCIYGSTELLKLQQILFYKELGYELTDIKQILNNPSFNHAAALAQHKTAIIQKIESLQLACQTIDYTIQTLEKGENIMPEKLFESFKENLVAQNEEKYGKEARALYGSDAIEASNSKIKNMSKDDYQALESLNCKILAQLDELYTQNDYKSAKAIELAKLHREWLCFYWEDYTPEAHMGLAQMYVSDPRFAKYYNRGTVGKAEFMQRCINHYASTL